MTRRGWSVLGAGFGLWVVGRMLGIGELFQLALVLVMLCLLSLVHVSWGRHHLQVERHLPAVRVHRGSYLGLELSVTNPHRLRTPLVTLIEDLPPPLGTHKFSVTVEPRRQRLISYGLWPDRRGLYTLPPTRTLVGDPFGLARRTGSHGSSSTLIVYPRVEELASPEGSSARLTRGTRSRHLPAAGGEDFYGIRDYVPGDDRRKVHWRSTARTGRLMVREDETTGLPRLAVFVDDRESSHPHSDDSFEWVVEAAASIVSLYSKKQYADRKSVV